MLFRPQQLHVKREAVVYNSTGLKIFCEKLHFRDGLV